MRNKLKKMLLAVLCICAISGAAVVIPARAADHVCTNDMKVLKKKDGPQSYEYFDGMYHNSKYTGYFHCSICDRFMEVKIIEIKEDHSFRLYESQGHSGKEHDYKLTCQFCGGTRIITIPCLYNSTGKHTTPW